MKKIYSVLTIVLVVLLYIACSKWYIAQRELNEVREHYLRWDKLNVVLNEVDKNYVEEIDRDSITGLALPHILKELDPHSAYFPPREKEKAVESLAGDFEGIGVEFNVPNDTLIVNHVIAGGPSERAGLISGDRIVEVDGRVIAGVKMTNDTIISLLRGPKGSRLQVKVKRNNEMVDFEIIRDKIPVESVDVAYMIDDTTAYLKLSKFTRSTYKDFVTAMQPLPLNDIRKVIFDLRDNTGGYLDQALLLANEFLKKDDLIVYMEGLHKARQDFYADGRGLFQNVELVVLINGISASSSEIFAGAMQDNDRATIIGRRSFGKGLVQEPINFTDGSAIWLTIARFYSPTGRCIQKPYSNYDSEIFDRYVGGELMSKDSIKYNGDLKYTTPGGKVVYGGGGIIPDVFVPLDTISDNDLLVAMNSKSLQVKFAIDYADRHRSALVDVDDLDALMEVLDRLDIEPSYKAYVEAQGMTFNDAQWAKAYAVAGIQIKALVGRYSKLDDNAFYPIMSVLDNVIDSALVVR